MCNLRKFHFTIPVTEIAVINGRKGPVHHGDIVVKGDYTSKDDFDYDEVSWQGVDLFALLQAFTPEGDFMANVNAIVSEHVADLIQEQYKTVAA